MQEKPAGRPLDIATHGGDQDSAAVDQHELVRQLVTQSETLSDIRTGAELDTCLLDTVARLACVIANETHEQTRHVKHIEESLGSLLEIYRTVHSEQALQFDNLARLRSEVRKCCPPDEHPSPICEYEPCEPHGGIRIGDGYSMKSRAFINALEISDEPHKPWTIKGDTLNENQILPKVRQGRIVGQLVPSLPTPGVLDFRSGAVPSGSQQPVTFRTFTTTGIKTAVWPPDMSGAKGGDVVLMTGNLWVKLSVDGGKTFTDLKFTDLFDADNTFGGWAGDQVVLYVPSIDCFVLYVQSAPGTGANASKSVIKVALASPDDLKKFKGGRPAWRRQWNFTSDTFGLNFWLDFPDMSYGDGFLYINTNTFARGKDSKGATQDTFQGKLFFELPLKELKSGSGFTFQYAHITDALTFSSPTQNIGDENYWAAHVDNSTMRIYSSKGTDVNYFWRERNLGANWPTASKSKAVKPEDNEDNIVSAAQDSPDWISEDHRILGATKVGNVLWFGWTAAEGDGGAGGFKFLQPHIHIAKFDVSQDYKFLEQTQVWNSDVAFAYPSLTTNSNFEVGISLAWGGGKSFGSHAVGILGDFVVWFGEASDKTSAFLNPTRFGDYVQVRLAHPDTRFFSAFGYAVKKNPGAPPAEKADYLYVEFGREAVPTPPLR